MKINFIVENQSRNLGVRSSSALNLERTRKNIIALLVESLK